MKNGVKDFLRCRTVGLPMVHNRLLGFQVVKSTRPVQYFVSAFIPGKDYRVPRSDSHKARCPGFPDPHYHFNKTQEYLFRNERLRHLRLEAFHRYFSCASEQHRDETLEDTVGEPDNVFVDPCHRNYDPDAEALVPGEGAALRPAFWNAEWTTLNAAIWATFGPA